MPELRLSDLFTQLQNERKQTWPPDQLAKNAAQRLALVQSHDPSQHARIGDKVSPFTLIDATGRAVTRDALLNDGPAVLIFFRYGGCPACNIAIPFYDRVLRPLLRDSKTQLIAISPQTPVDQGFIQRHKLNLPVFTDPDYALARTLGITFYPAETPSVAPGTDWIGSTLGTLSWEMVKPAVVILGQDGAIDFIDVSPDWLERTEPSVIHRAIGSSTSAS